MEQPLSSPSPEQLRCWRLYFESALALVDVLDTELQAAAGIPQRWYDVLIHLEESPDGIPMTELADQILYSKSGFTRVIDRMEEAGLVSRVRPPNDRRSILVTITDQGTKTMETPAATTATASTATSQGTSPTPTPKPSPTPSKKSAPTLAHSAPAASAANTATQPTEQSTALADPSSTHPTARRRRVCPTSRVPYNPRKISFQGGGERWFIPGRSRPPGAAASATPHRAYGVTG